ncbi:SHOCT domain-containing protein [Candidatus Woesearchaeota archaeon]|nr:SHOCT domain-containing protein [Candidatus Woesearchaeota archaeon]
MKTKESTPEEKKETMMVGIFLVVSAVVTYFFDKWLVVDLLRPLARIFGVNLGTGWRIGIAVFVFIVGWGTMYQAYNKAMFYDTHKHGVKPQEDATSKIAKLKELKDKGAISKAEFEKKKKELLKSI